VSNDFKKWVVKRYNPSKLTSIYVACDSDMSFLGGGRKFTFKEFDFIDQEVRCVESTSPYQYEFTKKAEKKFSQFLNEAIKYKYKVKFEMSDLKEITPNMRKKDSWIIIPFSDRSIVTKAVSRGIYLHFVGTTLTSNQKKKAFCEEHGFSWIDAKLSIMFDLVVVGDKYPDNIKSSTANDVWEWSKLMYYYKMLPQERRPIFVRESTFNEILEAMSE
jgi:hypothetical protein